MIISSIIGDDVQSLLFSICRGSIEAQIIDNYTCFFYGIPSLSAIQNTKIDDSGNLANNIALEEKNIIVI